MPAIPLYNTESAGYCYSASGNVQVRCCSVLCKIFNMKFFIVAFFALLAMARAQFAHFGFQDNFAAGGYGLNAAVRDPRANTGSLAPLAQMPNGPVLFPPAPADSGMTSGVVVGASGFGFVPPNQPSAKAQALPFF